jgi:hypothetical protein
MLFFSICLSVLFGVSLITFAKLRPKPASVRSAYGMPPADWPDVPVGSLGLFQREGRINAVLIRPAPPKVARLYSFEEAQAFVLKRVRPGTGHIPQIALKLSDSDGPTWTDVIVDGCVIAHMPTAVLAAGPTGQRL